MNGGRNSRWLRIPFYKSLGPKVHRPIPGDAADEHESIARIGRNCQVRIITASENTPVVPSGVMWRSIADDEHSSRAALIRVLSGPVAQAPTFEQKAWRGLKVVLRAPVAAPSV